MSSKSFVPTYDENDNSVMSCPGCNKQQWYIGRITAECVFCGSAVELKHVNQQSYQPRFTSTVSKTAKGFLG